MKAPSRRLCVQNLIRRTPYNKSHNCKGAVRQKGHKHDEYDARACHFNMDTGCVELLLRDGRMISIDCTGVEDELDVTMAQRSEYLFIYFDTLLFFYFYLYIEGRKNEDLWRGGRGKRVKKKYFFFF